MALAKKLLDLVRLHLTDIYIFLVFVAVSVAVTYPLVFRTSTSLYTGDIRAGFFSNDAKGVIHILWWAKYALMRGLPWKLITVVGVPYGTSLIQAPVQPGTQFPFFILALLKNEIFAHNFLVLLSFPLSAFTAYSLAHYLTGNKLASFVSGLIYSLSSYHVFQSYSHLGLAMIQWIPLYVLSLFRFVEERTYLRAAWCAVFFSLVTLTAYYYGYFMLIFSLTFFIFLFFYEYLSKRKVPDYKTLKAVMVVILLSLVLVVPFLFNLFIFGNPRFEPVSPETAKFTVDHFAARWWSYLVPSFESPFFGPYVQGYLYKHLSGNPAEQVLYLGYLPMALGLVAVLAQWHRRKRREESRFGGDRFTVGFFALMVIVAIIWSAPPIIALGKYKVTMPSGLAYGIAPMFRQYGRFGLLAILSISVLAGFGLRDILENLKSSRKAILVVLLLTILLLVELLNIPPFKTLDVSAKAVPREYRWLATQTGGFAIAEYPILTESDPRQYDYLFFQRIHRKRMINAIPGSQNYGLLSYLSDLNSPDTLSTLSYLGVKYLVVHPSLYRANGEEVPKISSRRGLNLVKTFPGTFVYRIQAQPGKILWLRYKDFYPADTRERDEMWNWMARDAELLAVNYAGRVLRSDIFFSAVALGKPRLLRIEVNKKLVKELIVPAFETEIVLKDVRLKPGDNSIVFSTDSVPEQVDSYRHDGDSRKATLAFSNFRDSRDPGSNHNQ